MDHFTFKNKNNIVYAVSENLGVPNAFSTRHGGVSALPHTATMNLAYGRGDDEDTVRENYRIFCGVLGIDSKSIVSAKQVHSAKVLTVTPADAAIEGYEADGFVTNTPGVTLCVKVADCVPILFCDEKNGVIGACHAGWKGTVNNIATITAEKMCALGATREHIQVAIGACIHPCCYEVQEDFRDAVSEIRGTAFAARHIKETDGALHADLPAMNLELLCEAGIPAQNISVCGRCTCCEPELFFSHRATRGVRGTMAAIISL